MHLHTLTVCRTPTHTNTHHHTPTHMQPDVCDTFKVAGYPTMYLGTAGDVAAAAVPSLTKFDHGKYARTAEGVVQCVAAHFKL
jgi:hypothetical protein